MKPNKKWSLGLSGNSIRPNFWRFLVGNRMIYKLESIGLRDPTFSRTMYIPFLIGHTLSAKYFGSRCAKGCASPLLSFSLSFLVLGCLSQIQLVISRSLSLRLHQVSLFILRRLVVSDKPLHVWAILVLSTCWWYRGRWPWHSSWDSFRTHCKA